MFAAVKPLYKFLQYKPVRIYDNIFTIHSKCTVVILLTCTVLLSTKQHFGNPIHCISDAKNKEFVNNFCWTMGTYVLDYYLFGMPTQQQSFNEPGYTKEYFRKAMIADGVGPIPHRKSKANVGDNDESHRIYLRYYQWVIMCLLVQSVVFYLPSFLWKVWEGARMKQLCSDVAVRAVVPEETYQTHRKMLLKYFKADMQSIHLGYVSKYLFCELLNSIISLLNIGFLNVFLDGFWYKYMYALWSIGKYDWNEWSEMTSHIFPKVAKCEFINFGSSGSHNMYDTLCLLPLNILNEKVFAFLWGWFLLIALLSAGNLLYRVLQICVRRFRTKLLHALLRPMSKPELKNYFERITFADWFVLYNLGKNIHPMLFEDLMQDLCKMENEKQTSESMPEPTGLATIRRAPYVCSLDMPSRNAKKKYVTSVAYCELALPRAQSMDDNSSNHSSDESIQNSFAHMELEASFSSSSEHNSTYV